MKKLLLVFTLAFTFFINADAQTAAKAVFAEIGGPGLASINYDMRFKKEEGGLGFRIGVGGFNIDNSGIIIVPIGINYLLGKDNRNYFELGAGISYIHTSGDFTNTGDPFSSTFGHFNIGYRLAPARGGFLFRASINPVFGKGFFVPYYGGISFGYKF